MIKLDLKRKYRHLYNPTPRLPSIVDVPEFHFLMIDGHGNPNTSPQYQDAMQALYGVSYMLKKSNREVDYTVMALEGLWWTETLAEFTMANKDAWKWTMMIMQPEFVTDDDVQQAIEQVTQKRELAAVSQIRFEPFHEGVCVQIMHLGPYAAEAPTIERLHEFIRLNHYQAHGKHHEVYLSDPRKAAPERLKTIIRQPVR